MLMKKVHLIVAVIIVLAATACAPSGPSIRIEDAWVRPGPLMENGAGYFTIYNDGDEADTLIGVSVSFARMASPHQTVLENDISRMEAVPQLEIPAGGSVIFEPLSYHVMIMGLKPDLIVIGETVELILSFEKSGEITVTAEVRRDY